MEVCLKCDMSVVRERGNVPLFRLFVDHPTKDLEQSFIGGLSLAISLGISIDSTSCDQHHVLRTVVERGH